MNTDDKSMPNSIRPKIIIEDTVKLPFPDHTSLYDLKRFIEKQILKYGQRATIDITSFTPIRTKITFNRFETNEEYVIRRLAEEDRKEKRRNNIFKIKLF